MSQQRGREKEREKMPFILANYVSACSQGQCRHSSRTNLTIMIQNLDNSEQKLSQNFLILRPDCKLQMLLLGHDFLTEKLSHLTYMKQRIEFKLNRICIQT